MNKDIQKKKERRIPTKADIYRRRRRIESLEGLPLTRQEKVETLIRERLLIATHKQTDTDDIILTDKELERCMNIFKADQRIIRQAKDTDDAQTIRSELVARLDRLYQRSFDNGHYQAALKAAVSWAKAAGYDIEQTTINLNTGGDGRDRMGREIQAIVDARPEAWDVLTAKMLDIQDIVDVYKKEIGLEDIL